jgi:hypothetical protein
MTIESNDTDEIVAQLSGLSFEKMEMWRNNISAVPEETYLYTGESDELKQALLDSVGGRAK